MSVYSLWKEEMGSFYFGVPSIVNDSLIPCISSLVMVLCLVLGWATGRDPFFF